jgi:membrane protein DedA with SNARE-associated domain
MVLEGFATFVISLVSSFGYLGAFAGMLIETVFPPIPSELIMPFAGYLASIADLGYVGLTGMIIAGTLGATLGAIIIYYISLTAGRAVVLRYGKYVLIDEENLSAAERWFKKYGKKAIFLGRMAPGIRELISIPAGLSKMDFKEFLLFTFAGSLIWTAFLGIIGFALGEAWRTLALSGMTDFIALILLACVAAYLIYKKLIKKKK